MSNHGKEDTMKIEIHFARAVEIPDKLFQEIVGKVNEVCKNYEKNHPGRVMWPAGIGSKVTYMPMTQEDEKTRGMEFDPDTLSIECMEREDYDWPCKKCDLNQGDHKHVTAEPKTNCDYEPVDRKDQ